MRAFMAIFKAIWFEMEREKEKEMKFYLSIGTERKKNKKKTMELGILIYSSKLTNLTHDCCGA